MKNKKMIYLIAGILVIIFGVMITLVIVNGKSNSENSDGEKTEEAVKEVEKKLNIVDLDSNTRPYAVMINNNHAAWPQAGIQDAYLVYEIVVEGGITRMMALYKDADTAKIGSIRSSRHYFLDYALENDAIYVHFGWSPKAQSDISSLGINNINGLYDSSFWRDTSLNRAYEHTAFTSIEKLNATANSKGYRMESNKDLLLNYSVDEININEKEGSVVANNVSIKYSYYHTTSYEYDSVNKVYKRSMSGVANTDLETGVQYTAKNIITYQVEDTALADTENKGRRDLNNIGSGDGYYITNGYAVPITWEKKSRSSQTVYKYKNGNEINVNDGNTFIQIQPVGQTLTIN